MNLDEALAVYLYLRNSDGAGFNAKVFNAAWKVIEEEAVKTMTRQSASSQSPTLEKA